VHSHSSPRLLQDTGGGAVDLKYLAVDFSQPLGVVVLLVVAGTHLLPHVVADRTQDLYVLVALTGLTHFRWIIEADRYQGDVVSGAPRHRLQQKGLSTSSVPAFSLLLLFVGLLHDLHRLRIVELVPETVRANHDEVMVVNLKTGDFWLVDDDLVLGLLGLKVAECASGG
jgi:hypothetical protein